MSVVNFIVPEFDVVDLFVGFRAVYPVVITVGIRTVGHDYSKSRDRNGRDALETVAWSRDPQSKYQCSSLSVVIQPGRPTGICPPQQMDIRAVNAQSGKVVSRHRW